MAFPSRLYDLLDPRVYLLVGGIMGHGINILLWMPVLALCTPDSNHLLRDVTR